MARPFYHPGRFLAQVVALAFVAVLPSALAQSPSANAASVMGQVNLAAAAKPVASTHRTAAADATHYQHGASTGSTGVPVDSELVAAVYAEPRDDATKAAVAALPTLAESKTAATITQKGMRFIPTVLPIRVGTAVNFPNEDDMYHNVFSYSSTHPFDLGRYRKDEKPAQVVFDKKGVVKVYCEIHEFMRATILVLDTPYFTVSDPEGHFQLSNLAPGAYTLTAWVNDKTVWSRPLEVKAGEAARVDLAPESSVKSTP